MGTGWLKRKTFEEGRVFLSRCAAGFSAESTEQGNVMQGGLRNMGNDTHITICAHCCEQLQRQPIQLLAPSKSSHPPASSAGTALMRAVKSAGTRTAAL